MEVYDPLYGPIHIPELLRPIVNSQWFRRLQHLRQLGVCYLSFPGGNHTRFEHSLGAFHLAAKISRLVGRANFLSLGDRERLSWLMQLGALCHDIGHGPYSHMTENVLLGLGSKAGHEEVGAAIIAYQLREFILPFSGWDISPELIGLMMTKDNTDDALVSCATTLVSSDLDVDRLDYLHRDSHYSGMSSSKLDPDIDFANVWELRRVGASFRFELTERGTHYAEDILFKRRNNYRDIVFESRHMAATGMFEKAISLAAKTDSPFGQAAREIVNVSFDWRNPRTAQADFSVMWKLYGLVDYEAIELLDTASSDTHYLVERIRRGMFFETVERFDWSDIHYLSKQEILSQKSEHQIFGLRRRLEDRLGSVAGIDPLHIVCHLQRFPSSKLLAVGTTRGNLLEERSALGAFLAADASHGYAAEIFIDPSVDHGAKKLVREIAEDIFKRGQLNSLANVVA